MNVCAPIALLLFISSSSGINAEPAVFGMVHCIYNNRPTQTSRCTRVAPKMRNGGCMDSCSQTGRKVRGDGACVMCMCGDQMVSARVENQKKCAYVR